MAEVPVLRPAVFLDRDGVLNRAVVRDGKPFPPRSVRELEILPGVSEACATLRQAGLVLIVVTNQPDVARGQTTLQQLAAIHAALVSRIPLDGVLVCPHDDDDRCRCRKPAPGLLLDAARDLDLALERSVMVGDRWRDVEVGRRAGCSTVFIDAGYSEEQPQGQDLTVASLSDAVSWILNRCISKEEPRDDN